MELKDYIRDVPDFPSPGILFRDITPLLSDPAAFRYSIDLLAERYEGWGIDAVVAIDARGFLFGAPLAYRLGKALVPVRKAGKLPFHSLRVEYSLEYGENVVEMHRDAVAPGQTALVVDDLLATGGTIHGRPPNWWSRWVVRWAVSRRSSSWSTSTDERSYRATTYSP